MVAILLAWLPWLLRGLSIIPALVGLFQTSEVASGEYAASPRSLGTIAAWLLTSAGTFWSSFKVSPAGREALLKAIDLVVKTLPRLPVEVRPVVRLSLISALKKSVETESAAKEIIDKLNEIQKLLIDSTPGGS